MNTLLDASALIGALGWTLVHFLWQGTALALVLGLALWLLRYRPATLRYGVACAALLAMAAAPVVTLAVLHVGGPLPMIPDPSAGVMARRATSTAPPGNVPPTFVDAAATTDAGTGDGSRLVRIEPLLRGLVTVWTLGVLVLSVRLLGGWLQVEKLKRRSTRPAPAGLQARADAIARRMRVPRTPRVLASTAVSVPTVIGGLFRSVILVPVAALAGMQASAIEALVAHELAHVRRRDHLVNLFQVVVETVLFYHPAVWWTSGQIRVLREHCCDDLAVAVVGDNIGYARALTALEELRSAGEGARPGLASTPPFALAATDGDLVGRVRRVVGLPPSRNGRRGGAFRPAARATGTALAATLLATLATSLHLRALAAADGPATPPPPVRPAGVVAPARPAAAPPVPALVRVVERPVAPAAAVALPPSIQEIPPAPARPPGGAVAPPAVAPTVPAMPSVSPPQAPPPAVAPVVAARTQADGRDRDRRRSENRETISEREIEALTGRIETLAEEMARQDLTEARRNELTEQITRLSIEISRQAMAQARREIERAKPEMERALAEAARERSRAREEMRRQQIQGRRNGGDAAAARREDRERRRRETEAARRARGGAGSAARDEETARMIGRQVREQLDTVLPEIEKQVQEEVRRALEEAQRSIEEALEEIDQAPRPGTAKP